MGAHERRAPLEATFSGSSRSSQPRGLPVFTAQNRHPRVQTSPMSMMVAVPSAQHSPKLGQRASSQTVYKPFSRSDLRSSAVVSPVGSFIFSQEGFLSVTGANLGTGTADYTPPLAKASDNQFGNIAEFNQYPWPTKSSSKLRVWESTRTLKVIAGRTSFLWVGRSHAGRATSK